MEGCLAPWNSSVKKRWSMVLLRLNSMHIVDRWRGRYVDNQQIQPDLYKYGVYWGVQKSATLFWRREVSDLEPLFPTNSSDLVCLQEGFGGERTDREKGDGRKEVWRTLLLSRVQSWWSNPPSWIQYLSQPHRLSAFLEYANHIIYSI